MISILHAADTSAIMMQETRTAAVLAARRQDYLEPGVIIWQADFLHCIELLL